MTYTNEKKKKVEGGLHQGTYTNEEKKSGRGHTPGDVYKQDKGDMEWSLHPRTYRNEKKKLKGGLHHWRYANKKKNDRRGGAYTQGHIQTRTRKVGGAHTG